MGRTCAACRRNLPRKSYTRSQWRKRPDISRCTTCVHGDLSDRPNYVKLGNCRHNLSTSGIVSEHPFAEGSFRWVGGGIYTVGPRAGQPSVTKWFKSGSVFSEDFFTLDIKAVDKALEFIDRFNEAHIFNKVIRLNIPLVWRVLSGSRQGERVLVEPFIRDYQKFNSNTGWANNAAGWAQVMQALSHFSYHASGGFYVLCDIQGGFQSRSLVLSDPVILSRTGKFGVTDLGPEGISTFFYWHRCNNYCQPHWRRPKNPSQHFNTVSGTSMLRRDVPTGAEVRPSSAVTGVSDLAIAKEDEKDEKDDN